LFLASINFRLTPAVDSSQVLKFLSWAGIPVPTAAPPCRPYDFSARQQGFESPFTLSFASPVIVAVARIEVANRLNVEREKVQLLFGGRVLRDSLVLENLELRNGDEIVVYVTDSTEFLFKVK
jgi:hypothetical protein